MQIENQCIHARAIKRGNQSRRRYYLCDPNGPNKGLPGGMVPGQAHAADLEDAARRAGVAEAERAQDPQFGGEAA